MARQLSGAWSGVGRGKREQENEEKRGHRDGEEEHRKRTVISRVIAPPDMTGTRERRHQHWLGSVWVGVGVGGH